MLANEAWDFVLRHEKDGLLQGSGAPSYMLYLIENGAVKKTGKNYVLTKEGADKVKRFRSMLGKLSTGIPIKQRSTSSQKHFLLRRDLVTAPWFKGRAGRVKELNRLFTFMTDRCLLVKGTRLLKENLRFSKDLYLHFFPVSKPFANMVDSLIVTAFSKKPKVLLPSIFQRKSLTNPGIVWFKDVDKNLYPLSAIYYDYLVKWSDRVRYEHEFGLVEVNRKQMMTLECKNAPSVLKLKGDMVAIVAIMSTKEQPNAEVSG